MSMREWCLVDCIKTPVRTYCFIQPISENELKKIRTICQAEEMLIDFFYNYLTRHNFNEIDLDKAISCFESVPVGQSLETFAKRKGRTAASYRKTYGKLFHLALQQYLARDYVLL